MYNNVTNFKHWFAVVCGTAFEIEIYGKELPAMAIKRVFQKEPVLSIAACLALVSSCFVLPDAEYLGYIDFRTLAILFSLMTVMAGLRGQGVFDRLGRALLSHTHTTLQLTAVLVGLCFFSSMVITNDVSLLTFVPFTFVVVNSLDAAVRDKLLLPIVCMQTMGSSSLSRTAASKLFTTTNVNGTKVSSDTSLVITMLEKKHSPTRTAVS